jgi:hypothetical protein
VDACRKVRRPKAQAEEERDDDEYLQQLIDEDGEKAATQPSEIVGQCDAFRCANVDVPLHDGGLALRGAKTLV